VESPSTPELGEDRKILLALFDPMTDHADGCLFKTSGLCCQCGFSTVVGHYLWALRRAKEIAAEHHGKVFEAHAPAEEDVGQMQAEGWAIIESTGIDVRSISPTRRAAIVNWLVVRRNIYITTSWDDARIEHIWQSLKGEAEAVEVIVRTK
jgi:hypothetical protein